MTTHPYRGLPAHQFWSTGVAPVTAAALDPVVSVPFVFSPTDPVEPSTTTPIMR